ncbi:MAG: sugar phosphate isomerase/epimerase [Thermodesulfobacteriota bacterium]|nr:sugar phosphate isomerase/epimerase [Thermodesulfobacteriota bacterium]
MKKECSSIDSPKGEKPHDIKRGEIHLGGTARSAEDVVSISELGLQFAEIPIVDPDEFQALKGRYQSLGRELGIYYLCHAPAEENPREEDPLENIYFPKLIKTLSVMPDLDMSILTLHLLMDARFVSRDVIVYKIGFLERLIERAADLGITICLENLSEHVAHMDDVFEALPTLYMCLDLGHAQLLTEENTSYGFIDKYPERIKHIHVHDNRGGDSPNDDLHLPVGEGLVDFEKIFQKLMAIGYCGTITLELKPHEIRECLGYVRELTALH